MFLGLEVALLLLPTGPVTEGRVAQTVLGVGKGTDAKELGPTELLLETRGCALDAPGLLGRDPGHPAVSTLRRAAELLGCEAGYKGVEGSREVVVSGGSNGSKVGVSALLSDVEDTDPVAIEPPG